MNSQSETVIWGTGTKQQQEEEDNKVKDFLNNVAFPSIELLGTAIFVLAASYLFASINGLNIDSESIISLVLIAIIAAVGIMILTKMF